VNDDPVKSIRRESFMQSFVIKEVVEEDAKSLTIDDIDDMDITCKHTNGGDMDVSFLDSSIFDKSQGPQLQPTSYSSRSGSQDSLATPPNFAGGRNRRRGDQQRRMRQRFGVRDSFGDNRRGSTGTMGTAGNISVQESFGDMSLQSFTSVNSFTSTNGATGGQNIISEVGKLVFVTDAEMAKLMYGDENDATNKIPASPLGRSSDFASRRGSVSSITYTSSNLSSSLPPSAILGTGAFSTVRLAWRKTPDHSQYNDDNVEPSTSYQEMDENGPEREERRSIVRVQSKTSDVDSNASPNSKGELVAVKIIQKSILKQMKTMQKGDNNRMTVHTAYDNIEREIATMKRLQHPNLVRLFEVIDSVESDKLHMVLEYVSLGEILSHVEGTNQYKRMRYRKKVKGLTAEGHFDEKHAALYFVDVMHGLAYLHRNRICHRDLKPENILLCASGIAKIGDFGVSHMFDDEKRHESFMLSVRDEESLDDSLSSSESSRIDDKEGSPSHLSKRESDSALNMSSLFNSGMLKKTEGTWCFWSPEMCSTESKGFSGYAADLWAAGVCLYIFTTGSLPFFSMNPTDLFDLIAKGEVQYEGLVFSDELKNLLGKLLMKDVSTRAGVGDCLKHKFCADARMKRIGELGNKFKSSEEHIILSKNDVEMALSITVPLKGLRKMISKRFSAPAASLSSHQTFSKLLPAADYPAPAVATIVEYNPKSTTLTENWTEPNAHNLSDNSSTHSDGSTSKMSKKKVGLASKFKLKKNWWRSKRAIGK